MLPPSRCALASSLSLLLSLSQVVGSQGSLSTLSFDTPLTLSGNNFSTTSTPLLFSLPSDSQITISLALCDAPSSSPPLVFVTNSSSSQVIPGPSGGSDVFEVTLSSLGLGNFTLEFPAGDTTGGVLAVYGGTTSDSLEIGVSQGGRSLLSPSYSITFISEHKRQHRSTRPFRTYPSLATRPRTKPSFSPQPSSHPAPRPSRHTQITPSRRRTRPCQTHRPLNLTLPSSSPRSLPGSLGSRRQHAPSERP